MYGLFGLLLLTMLLQLEAFNHLILHRKISEKVRFSKFCVTFLAQMLFIKDKNK